MGEEIWKPVKDYEGYYEVSNLGRVKSLVGYNGKEYIEREKILKNSIQISGSSYKRYAVTLSIKSKVKHCKVHKLVAETFVPNPNNYKIINHKDGNSLNNHIDNLEWCTMSDNLQHAYIMKLKKSKIHNMDRQQVVNMLNSGLMQKDIAKILKISEHTIMRFIKKENIKRGDFY